MEWLSANQIPEKEQEVIVYFKNSVGYHVSTAYWDGVDFFNLCEECDYKEPYKYHATITYWMPLPEPPKTN